MSAIVYPRNLPVHWAEDKLPTMSAWWNGEPGAIMRRVMPLVFPGMPVEAHFGFVANGGWTEDTVLTDPHQAFHELGGYGITGGPRSVPAPNCDRSRENDWCQLHADPDVVHLLGRSATMAPFPISGHRIEIPLEDQVAVGAVSLKHKRDRVNAGLDPRIRIRDLSGLWGLALSFAAWSSGVGGAVHMANQFAGQLAGVAEGERWTAFLGAVAEAARSGALPPGTAHGHAVYDVIRTQQKIRASQALARRIGADPGWYGPVLDAEEDVIARASGGATVAGGTSRSSGGPEPSAREQTIAKVEQRLGPPKSRRGEAIAAGVTVVAIAAVTGMLVWTFGGQRRRGRSSRQGSRTW